MPEPDTNVSKYNNVPKTVAEGKGATDSAASKAIE